MFSTLIQALGNSGAIYDMIVLGSITRSRTSASRSSCACTRIGIPAQSLVRSWQAVTKSADDIASTPRSVRQVGVVLVDHGSRKASANEALQEFADLFKRYTTYDVVEVAHMELADPTIAEAMQCCYKQECSHIVIAPYFLSPGRHVVEDIPRLVNEARENLDGVTVEIADPIGNLQMFGPKTLGGALNLRASPLNKQVINTPDMVQGLTGFSPNS